MPLICIDFGTSAIRAALKKDEKSKAIPLIIAKDSDIDNASIASAVAITADEISVLFGNSAIKELRKNTFKGWGESSPKSWFFGEEINKIDEPAFNGRGLSRFQLITGLVCFSARQARFAALDAMKLPREYKTKFDYRITHPIWPVEKSERIFEKYKIILDLITREAGAHLPQIVSKKTLQKWFEDHLKTASRAPNSMPATDQPNPEEPVAAALQLIGKPKNNTRELVLVVDVGAGTTDLGLFISAVPNSGENFKLARLGEPASLYYAGDHIDRALIKYVKARPEKTSPVAIAAFLNNIRKNKERLFSDGSLTIPGRSEALLLKNFQQTANIKEMESELTTVLIGLLEGATIPTGSGGHPINSISVVYAGGGSKIGFIRRTINQALKSSQPHLIISEVDTMDDLSSAGVDAKLPRMAVAMGGTTSKEDWPAGKKKAPYYLSLG